MINTDNELSKGSWKERHAHLPWYRKYEFIVPTLFLIVLLFLFIPTLTLWTTILFILIYISLLLLTLSDREKPGWFKNTISIGLILLLIYIFFSRSNIEWHLLKDVFFNFEIMQKGDPFAGGKSYSNWYLLFLGVITALKIFLYSAILGSLLGLFIAIMRTIVNDKILNFFFIIYIDFMRSIPMLVLLIIIYSALPYTGILLSPLASGVLTLGLVQGAYLSEVFRAGIEAIHHVQIEAARALGLSTWKTMRYVTLPQAMKIVIPPYTSTLVGLMKGTALCSQITIYEILKTAYQIQAWYANPTPLILASMFYLVILIPMTRFSSVLEKRGKVFKS